MSTEVIREFLVQLGFKSDEKSLKKFKDGVEGATAAVGKLVAGIAGAALTVSAGVAAFAANMEALYFASTKTGASASGVRALSAAVQNLTGNGKDAINSLEGIARFMRETPGAEGFLKSLGVDARDANGQLRKTEDITIDLLKQLSTKDYAIAKQYASLLGIGEDTLLASRKDGFDEEIRKQFELAKAYEGADKKAHEFEVRLREVESRIKSVGVTIGSSLLDVLGPQMEETAKWFEQNAGEISKAVSAIGKTIVTVGGFIGPILNTIAEGWKNIFSWINAAGEALANSRFANAVGKGMAWMFDKLGIRDQVDAVLAGGGAPAASPAKAGAGSAADPMKFFMGLGWSKDQAAGIVANLKHESNMNPGAVGDNGKAYGIAQWHPDRQANFAKWAGKDIRNSTAEEQMAFVNYELTQGSERKAGMLLKASQSSDMAGRVMSKYYERPANEAAEASARGATAVRLAQNTTINVNGGDAAATGRAVANEQDRVNQNLTRNMQLAYN